MNSHAQIPKCVYTLVFIGSHIYATRKGSKRRDRESKENEIRGQKEAAKGSSKSTSKLEKQSKGR